MEEPRILDLVASSIALAVCAFDLDNKAIFVNPAAGRLIGWAPSEALGHRCYVLFGDENPPLSEFCPLSRAVKDRATVRRERTIRSRTGKELEVAILISPLVDGDRVIGSVMALHDISEQRRAEEALEVERKQLLSIFDSIDEVVYVSDPETYEVLFANRAVTDAFGDVVGRKCFQVFQELKAPCSFCTNDRIFGENEGQPYVWEFKNDRVGRWYRCIDRAIRWPDGRLVRCELAIDTHDRNIAEQALRESEHKFRVLV